MTNFEYARRLLGHINSKWRIARSIPQLNLLHFHIRLLKFLIIAIQLLDRFSEYCYQSVIEGVEQTFVGFHYND